MLHRLHFVGIGGVGMAGLAYLLHRDGYAVSGCDRYASPRTHWLAEQGIRVDIGHDPAHLLAADAVVVTPAVPAEEPERRAAQERGMSVLQRGDVLAQLVGRRFGIAVCGSHGKTTTATFTAKLLRALGDDPAWCIGGETGSFPVAGAGRGPLVVEADESDGTLANYRAKLLVITNIDYDHPEHFKTPEAYRACYDTAAAQAETVIRAEELPSDDWPELPSLVTGAHNVRNARTAVAVALHLGHASEDIRRALPEVLKELPDRRFQRLSPSDAPFAVYTDYAHHPREIACALAMARARQPKRVRVLFQPHRHSRTKTLCDDFPSALAAADETILIPVYPAFEKPILGGDIADLYKSFREQFPEKCVRLARSTEEAWRHIVLTRRDGDLVLLLGAGDIVRIVPQILRDLSEGAGGVRVRASAADTEAGPPRADIRWIGAGSNTWKSDLASDVTYRRTTGPAGQPGATLNIPWMAGIPGTIGGWVKMNAGAFGHSISEVIRRVCVDGRWLSREACGFGYRTSSITGEIRDVEWDFSALDPHGPTAAEYRARRRKFPAGTKGSVFKNPSPERPAGRLLEEAGMKGLRVGGAYVWPEHANVIVAGPDATASDFLALVRLMRAAVWFRFGIRLQPEVCGLDVEP